MRRINQGGRKVKTKEKQDLSKVLSLINQKKGEVETWESEIKRSVAEKKSAELAQKRAIELKNLAIQELEEIQSQIVAKRHELENVKFDVSVAEKQKLTVSEEIENLRSKGIEIQDGHAELILKNKNQFSIEKERLNSELRKVEEQIQTGKDTINHLVAQKESLEGISGSLHNQIGEQLQKIDKLVSQEEAIKNVIKSLMGEFESSQERYRAQSKLVADSENQLTQKQKELVAIKAEISRAAEELNNTRLSIVAVIEKADNIQDKEEKLANILKKLGLALEL